MLEEKNWKLFFKEGTTQTGREKKTTQTDNRAFKWSNHKKFQKITKCFEQNFTQRKEGEQTAAAETSEAVICEIPPRLRLSFHSTLESYIHKPKCIFILYQSLSLIHQSKMGLKGLLVGLQKSVFFGCSLSYMRPRK